MSFYISQILLNAAKLLMDVRLGTATGGSTTTLVDTSCSEVASYYNGGTLWSLSGNCGNMSFRITTWDLVTHTFTIESATNPHLAGELYAVAPDKYTKDELLSAYNLAMMEVGDKVDSTTTSAVADQLIYSLTAYSFLRVVRVQTYAGTTVNEAVDHYHWKVEGTNLIFEPGTEPEAGETIRIYYVTEQSPVTGDYSTVTTPIPQDLLTWKTVFYAAVQRARKAENNDPGAMEMLKMAAEMCKMLEAKNPAGLPQPTPKLARWE